VKIRSSRFRSSRRSAEGIVAFYNKRGTAEQHIKEGKGAIKWTRLSCRTFAANAVRLQLHALAYLGTVASSAIGLGNVVMLAACGVANDGRYLAVVLGRATSSRIGPSGWPKRQSQQSPGRRPPSASPDHDTAARRRSRPHSRPEPSTGRFSKYPILSCKTRLAGSRIARPDAIQPWPRRGATCSSSAPDRRSWQSSVAPRAAVACSRRLRLQEIRRSRDWQRRRRPGK
jgi:hypothetical protein